MNHPGLNIQFGNRALEKRAKRGQVTKTHDLANNKKSRRFYRLFGNILVEFSEFADQHGLLRKGALLHEGDRSGRVDPFTSELCNNRW